MEDVRAVLEDVGKGLGKYTEALMSDDVGVQSVEDMAIIDEEIMKAVGMSMIHRKKLKAWIESGGPKSNEPSKTRIKRKSISRVPIFTSPSMKSVVKVDKGNESTIESAVVSPPPARSAPEHLPPMPPSSSEVSDDTTLATKASVEGDDDEDSEDEEDEEIDFSDGKAKIKPPPMKPGEVRTSWMAEMETLTRSDGKKKTVTTYTVRLADGTSYLHIVTVDFDGTESSCDKAVPTEEKGSSDVVTVPQELAAMMHKLKELHKKNHGSSQCLTKIRRHSSDELGRLFSDLGLNETAAMLTEEGVEGDDFVDFEDEDLETFKIPRSVFNVLLGHAGGATPRNSAIDVIGTTTTTDGDSTKAVDRRADVSEVSTKLSALTTDDAGDAGSPDAGLDDEKIVIAKISKTVAGDVKDVIPSAKNFKSGDTVVITFGRRKNSVVTLVKTVPPKASDPHTCRWSVRLASGRVVKYPETKLAANTTGRAVVDSDSSRKMTLGIKKNMKARVMRRVRPREGSKDLNLKKGDVVQVMKILDDSTCLAMNTKNWQKGTVLTKHLAPL